MLIPDGFSTITPYLLVDGADQYIEFLKGAFGAELTLCARDEHGLVANAQLRLGDSMLMVTDAVEHCPAMKASYYLFVEDADAAMKRAVEHGAIQTMEVADMPYGDRQGGATDPAGNIWWISQRLSTEPYSA